MQKAESLLRAENVEGADTILKQLIKEPVNEPGWGLQLTYLRALYYNSKEDLLPASKLLIGLPEKAAQQKLYALAARSNVLMALIHEKTGALPDCKQHLDIAAGLLKKYRLDSLYPWYYVRLCSYYRQAGQKDSATNYAQKAIPLAVKYQDMRSLGDAHLLTGALLPATDYKQKIYHLEEALKCFLSQDNFSAASVMYRNISSLYSKQGDIQKAQAYNDSATRLVPASYPNETFLIWKERSGFFEQRKNYDSALYYYKKYANGELELALKNEGGKIKIFGLQYDAENRETKIKSQGNRFTTILIFSAAIALALLALTFQYYKIRKQKKAIEQHVSELSKLVQQKKILLAELQHRVKNNLQHILSLLDIQKESLGHNNIEEVIRENQNRVHSMALLHNKLSFTGGGEKVNFEEYLHDMAAHIKAAYDNPKTKINIQLNCSIEPLRIETAIPLGLVVVELMSNSLKHAFKEKTTGDIRIDVSVHPASGKNLLTYSDDGCGFDVSHPQQKGIGMDLINGLLSEINATVETNNNNGTTYSILF